MAKEKGAKKINRAADVITREYTIHMRKVLHGVGFKKRAPRAVKEVKKFAQKMMGTEVKPPPFIPPLPRPSLPRPAATPASQQPRSASQHFRDSDPATPRRPPDTAPSTLPEQQPSAPQQYHSGSSSAHSTHALEPLGRRALVAPGFAPLVPARKSVPQPGPLRFLLCVR